MGYDWTRFRVAVQDVEKLTGDTFWPRIDPEAAAEIKKDTDAVSVRIPKSKFGKGEQP